MKMQVIISIFIVFFSTICFSQENAKSTFNIKVFLQGPYENNSMSDELNKENLIPLSQPYTGNPWNYNGEEHVNKVPKDVVDWILVELSDDTNRSKIIERRAAFLRIDGKVTSLDGKTPIGFENVNEKNVYLIIHHRNHLPVMSRNKINIDNIVNYDFTLSEEKAFGNSLIDLKDGAFGMISGDSDSNGEINNQDFKKVASELFKIGYKNADLDMNGVINVLDYKKINKNLSKKTAFR